MNTSGLKTLPPRRELERAYLKKDAAYDGLFFVAVRTTGIFCRPVCPARAPLPKNVEFYATPREALVAGFRPCKRCRPLGQGVHPEWAQRLLTEVEKEAAPRITDGDLRRRGIDPATARRHFQRSFGMTFQAYTRARRLSHALTEIREGASVDDAVLKNGYESHSGFREAFVKNFGSTPAKSRDQDCVRLAWIESPLGPLVAGATEEGVCLLEFTDRRMLEAQFDTVKKRFKKPVLPGRNKHLDQLEAELAGYFAGTVKQFTVPLIYPGTDFQRRVWAGLLKIPYGETISYEELARRVGAPKGQRAVGRANGLNRIGIVIPCHRVINKGGALGGYGGGLRRKQFLLDLEREHQG